MLWIVFRCTAGAGDSSINLLRDGISDTGVGDEGGGRGAGRGRGTGDDVTVLAR